MQSTLSIVGAVIAALGGGAVIVLGLSAWVGKVWADRIGAADEARHARELKLQDAALAQLAEARSKRLEGLRRHYERQIEEFYGPLFNMVNQIFNANHVQSEVLERVDPAQAEVVRNYFYETYFEPMHGEIREILRSKLYLVEGAEMPESFYLYLKHASQERDQRRLWLKHRIDTSFLAGEPWPDDFYPDIEAGFRGAMRNYEDCLTGLKADS